MAHRLQHDLSLPNRLVACSSLSVWLRGQTSICSSLQRYCSRCCLLGLWMCLLCHKDASWVLTSLNGIRAYRGQLHHCTRDVQFTICCHDLISSIRKLVDEAPPPPPRFLSLSIFSLKLENWLSRCDSSRSMKPCGFSLLAREVCFEERLIWSSLLPPLLPL